jgi:NADH-quinone oxidoreductase subunit M
VDPVRFLGLSPLTWMVAIPAATAVGIVFTPATRKGAVRGLALAGMAANLAIAVWLVVAALGDLGIADASLRVLPALAQKAPWVREVGISWNVGADGISVAMLFLTSVVIVAGVLVSWTVEDRTKEFYLSLIALVTGVFGVFAVRDLFWFYFFYELAVIPMYLLIGIWGSTNKEYATMKLTLYLTTGAVAALVGLLLLYFKAGPVTPEEVAAFPALAPELGGPSFDLQHLLWARADRLFDGTWNGIRFQSFAFPFLLFGFGAIAPLWPLHTWSPMGHAAAPSAASMLHAGVLMKLGSYAILRIAIPALPEGAKVWLPVVAVLCMFNIVYGGLVAIAQKDMKFVVGYSSSSHMGYVMLGIASMTALGINGAVFLMFAHGVMTALAFALIGFFYDQTHVRTLPDLGGMSHQIPFVGTAFVFMTMASAGVPGFANFVSEVMVMFGAWQGGLKWQAVVSVFGIVITGVYLLRAVRDAFFGPRNPRWDGLRDATTPWQRLPFVFLTGVLLLFGFWPRLLTDVIAPGAQEMADLLAGTGG